MSLAMDIDNISDVLLADGLGTMSSSKMVRVDSLSMRMSFWSIRRKEGTISFMAVVALRECLPPERNVWSVNPGSHM